MSATHLDWTMVPYVRKSFAKHYITGEKYIENIDKEIAERLYADLKRNNPSITDDSYYRLNSKAYNYAMDMTEKEIYQAAEGMYHNLSIWATK